MGIFMCLILPVPPSFRKARVSDESLPCCFYSLHQITKMKSSKIIFKRIFPDALQSKPRNQEIVRTAEWDNMAFEETF